MTIMPDGLSKALSTDLPAVGQVLVGHVWDFHYYVSIVHLIS